VGPYFGKTAPHGSCPAWRIRPQSPSSSGAFPRECGRPASLPLQGRSAEAIIHVNPAACAAAAAAAAAEGGGEQGAPHAAAAPLLLRLHRLPADAARGAADAAPLFSVRAGDDAAVRGAALAAALLAGIGTGRPAVLLKCWGRDAMPAAAQARGRAGGLAAVGGGAAAVSVPGPSCAPAARRSSVARK
jgi:hypothetical protein